MPSLDEEQQTTKMKHVKFNEIDTMSEAKMGANRRDFTARIQGILGGYPPKS